MTGINRRQVYLIVKHALQKGDNKKLTQDVERHRKDGFGWRYDGLANWSADAIFAKLQELGADTDELRFREQATDAMRPMVLEEKWSESLEETGTFWDDFPFLAVEELWRRLTPDLPCPEFVADRLEEIVRASGQPRTRTPEEDLREVETALEVMDYLERFPPEEQAARWQEIQECGMCDHRSWLLGLVLEHAKHFPDKVTRVADVMSTFDDPANFQGDLALALAWAGRRDQSLDRARANLERFPEDVWIRIKAGDVYATLDDNLGALALYTQALAMARDPYDWEGAAERLVPLLSKLGRREEWGRLGQEHPKPADPPIIPFSRSPDVSPQAFAPIDPLGPIGVLTSGPSPQIVPVPRTPSLSRGKVGRNDPCPCGSGKKYKKCCLERA